MTFDPRAKLLSVSLLTTLALLGGNIGVLILTCGLSLLLAWITRVQLLFTRLRRLLLTFAAIFVVQSLFNRSGQPLLVLGQLTLIYSGGLLMGLHFVFRMLVIIICAAALATSNSRDTIQGLVQLKLPYTLCFMATTAIGFIPLLANEISDTLTALKFRGVNLQKIPVRQKAHALTYLFFPVLIQVLGRAHELSVALELRGFQVGQKRSSWYQLTLNRQDYLLMLGSSAVFILILLVRIRFL